MKKLLKILTLGSVILLAQACGDEVPKSFRGNFQDNDSGTTLTLKASSGTFDTGEGRILSASRSDLGFEDLLAGKPGIYTRFNPVNQKIYEVYWIQANEGTRDRGGDLEWFDAEILYFHMNIENEGPVEVIELIHAEEGTVMLDLKKKRWQMGWPADAPLLQMRRVK